MIISHCELQLNSIMFLLISALQILLTLSNKSRKTFRSIFLSFLMILSISGHIIFYLRCFLLRIDLIFSFLFRFRLWLFISCLSLHLWRESIFNFWNTFLLRWSSRCFKFVISSKLVSNPFQYFIINLI